MKGSVKLMGRKGFTPEYKEEIIKLVTERKKKIIEGKGFGFVEMSSPEEAEAAKTALNDSDFNGRPLKIDEAKPFKPRSDYGNNRRSY